MYHSQCPDFQTHTANLLNIQTNNKIGHKPKRKDSNDPNIAISRSGFQSRDAKYKENACLINKKGLNRKYSNDKIENLELKHTTPKIKTYPDDRPLGDDTGINREVEERPARFYQTS